MTALQVDGLSFQFPAGWQTTKYDDWSFYRKRFARMWNGIKAVDLLAIDPSHSLWLIEGKDYRKATRTKPSELPDEVAQKVFDTLAALLPAAMNGDDPAELKLAKAALKSKRLRVVLHLEQPAKHSRLFPRAIDPADVELKLRRLLKPIDAHPVVTEKRARRSLAWSVR